MPEPPPTPRWFRDAARAVGDELAAYLGATWAMIRRPGRFVLGWWHGREPRPNPVGMMATGAAITAATREVTSAVIGLDHASSFWAGVASALGPYLHYVLVGLLCHLALLGLGRRRPRPRPGDTVAVALYAGAGPSAVAAALAWLALLALHPWLDPAVVMPVALGVAFSVFCMALASTLGALHDAPVWAILVAFAVAFPVSGAIFGVAPAGDYGMHWVLRLDHGLALSLGL